jgi:hypothetical protein
VIDWPSFLREFGLPITILAVFVGAIVTGLLVAGKSVENERSVTKDRLLEWGQRYDDQRERADKAEARLDAILPALANVTALVSAIREELIRGDPHSRSTRDH